MCLKISIFIFLIFSFSAYAESICDVFSKEKFCKYKEECFGNKIEALCDNKSNCKLIIHNYKKLSSKILNVFLPSSADINCYNPYLGEIYIGTGTNESVSYFIDFKNLRLSQAFSDVFAVEPKQEKIAYLDLKNPSVITIGSITNPTDRIQIKRNYATGFPQLAVDARTHFDKYGNLVLTYIEAENDDIVTEKIKPKILNK